MKVWPEKEMPKIKTLITLTRTLLLVDTLKAWKTCWKQSKTVTDCLNRFHHLIVWNSARQAFSPCSPEWGGGVVTQEKWGWEVDEKLEKMGWLAGYPRGRSKARRDGNKICHMSQYFAMGKTHRNRNCYRMGAGTGSVNKGRVKFRAPSPSLV